MSIVFKYDFGKGSSDKKVIFYSGVQPNMDLIGLLGGGGSRNRICTKMIYPLFNGGINRITVSSNLLATSQYINGHKTATIAELQIGPSTNAQINPMEIQDSFDWKHEYFSFTMGRHKQHTNYNFPGEGISAPDPEYLPEILPDAITLFHCSNRLLSGFFEPVSIHAPISNNTNIVAMPNDTLHKIELENCALAQTCFHPFQTSG